MKRAFLHTTAYRSDSQTLFDASYGAGDDFRIMRRYFGDVTRMKTFCAAALLALFITNARAAANEYGVLELSKSAHISKNGQEIQYFLAVNFDTNKGRVYHFYESAKGENTDLNLQTHCIADLKAKFPDKFEPYAVVDVISFESVVLSAVLADWNVYSVITQRGPGDPELNNATKFRVVRQVNGP
jgi:hypothetical protein